MYKTENHDHELRMVAYSCSHFSDDYVDLIDLYVERVIWIFIKCLSSNQNQLFLHESIKIEYDIPRLRNILLPEHESRRLTYTQPIIHHNFDPVLSSDEILSQRK